VRSRRNGPLAPIVTIAATPAARARASTASRSVSKFHVEVTVRVDHRLRRRQRRQIGKLVERGASHKLRCGAVACHRFGWERR
jgi:hypothetical protein